MAQSGDQEISELPRSIALAWGVAANPQRGPRREMSVEKIVDVAIELADAEGLSAVSMAAVAKRLGFTPMALYRYITAKDDLLLLMQETAVGLPSEAVRAAQGWRAKLELLYREQLAVYLQHPWMLALPINGVPLTPNHSAWMEESIAALGETNLNSDERLAVSLQISGLARWAAIVAAGYNEFARESGLAPEEVTIREAELFDAVIDATEFPHLRRVIDEGTFVRDVDPFEFNIARALDGVADYMTRVGESRPTEPGAPVDVDLADDSDVQDDKKYRAARKATQEALKVLREAEKNVRTARKAQAQALKEARERRR